MKRIPILAWTAAALVTASLGWMVWEVGHPSVTVQILHPDGSDWSAVWRPSRTMIAYHAFLISVALLPPLYFGGLLRDPDRRAGSARRALFIRALCLCSLCAAGLLTGYLAEGLRAEIRLTSSSLLYRTGTERAIVDRVRVRGMRLHAGKQIQTLDLISPNQIVRIDLTAFGVPDRAVLVRQLPGWARLTQAYSHHADEMVWIRPPHQETP